MRKKAAIEQREREQCRQRKAKDAARERKRKAQPLQRRRNGGADQKGLREGRKKTQKSGGSANRGECAELSVERRDNADGRVHRGPAGVERGKTRRDEMRRQSGAGQDE